MRHAIDAAKEAGDTVGGAFEVVAHGVPPGLGSHVQWDRKLDGRLAQALMSIPAIKAVGHRLGPQQSAICQARKVHDEIVPATGRQPGRSRRLAPDQQRRRAGRRHHQRRGRPRHRLDEADLHADEAAPVGRADHDDARPRPRSSAATSARCPPRPSSAKRWWRSSSPTRCSRNSAATPCRDVDAALATYATTIASRLTAPLERVERAWPRRLPARLAAPGRGGPV